MIINFIYENNLYYNVLDSLYDPIIKYLPNESYKKSFKYEEGCLNVSCFVDSPNIPKKGVFMSHGIADKSWRNGSRVSPYDYICVSGDLWKEKMIREGIAEDKIWVVGYTKLDPIFASYNHISHDDKKINVLYAPTHNARADKFPDEVCLSCYPRLDKHFLNKPNNIEIKSSLHPANKEKHETTFDLYNWADVVVSGSSSTLYEALSLGIPVVFPDWLVKSQIMSVYSNSFEDKIYREKIGYHANSIEDFWSKIEYANNNGIDEKTSNFIDGIFPKKLRGKSGEALSKKLLSII